MSFNKRRSQRVNKERSQPSHRANLGPLEKHKVSMFLVFLRSRPVHTALMASSVGLCETRT